jgi:hypothetical protein
MSYFRRHDADEDPGKLLLPENQWSTPWGSHDHGHCDKCDRKEGMVEYRCLSCIERGADPACPACGGRVTFSDVCPSCEGSGEITNTRRRGVSAFPTIEGLRRYLADKGVDVSGEVIVEFDGELAGGRDLDADLGALLVIPQRILAAHPTGISV